uniref:Esterase n=1 Tax=Helicoverpa armigera TaxID=29058 RepID=L7P6C6_HELAM|nr:esterase [Helicoverpa armigera]
MVKSLILLCLLSLVYSDNPVKTKGFVRVLTRKGVIQGKVHDGYNTFFGIPYAKVNEENPFGRILDYPNFNDTFIADDPSVLCPQVYFNDNGVLQCLILNIYVPHSASTNNLLPILVWFHGGGFAFGSSGEYGGQYLVKHDIIVITVNYRQGAYGFLCLDDRNVPGNQGMKDQIEALRWIKRHIANFGGDPSKVTIAGESYGGGAVDLHLYSNYEMLFDKAIVQSGSIYVTEGIFIKPDYNAAIKLATYLGYNVTTTVKALEVLAKANPSDVNAATRNMSMILTLCKEKKFQGVTNFITDDPFHLSKPNRIKRTSIMIGYTSQEMLYEFANKPQSHYDRLGNPFLPQLTKTFILPKSELLRLSSIVQHFYLGGKTAGPETELELSNFLSDFAINYGVEWSVSRYIEQNAKAVYKYMFSYTGGSDYQNVTGSGASHTEELKYLFNWVWANPPSMPEQVLIRDRMTTMWANFVKFGNPTPLETDLIPLTWTPVSMSARPYMNIDVNMELRNFAFRHRMAFWELVWHTYGKKHVLLSDKSPPSL